MKLSLKEKLIFATGNLGISLITVIHMLYLVFIFMPSDVSGIAYTIPTEGILVIFTVLGLILFSSRIFDAVTDPWIASVSDQSQNKKGRRLPFMRKAAIPMGVFYVATFFVPFSNQIHPLNIVWITVTLLLSALFLTLYSIPYYTLMVDMGRNPDDLVDLSTYSSAFWFVGFLIVSFATSLWQPLENLLHISRINSIRYSFIILAVIGVLILFIPTIFLDEKNYKSNFKTEPLSFKTSLKTVSKNKNYVLFFIGNTAYGIATYIFETGLIYFITVLAILNENVQGPLTIGIGALTLASYPLINKMGKKVGKKPVMIIGFGLFAATFLVISILGLWGVNPYVPLVVIALLVPYSQAAFGILPGVVTADCTNYDKYVNKKDNAGMYVAATGFSSKLGGSLATIIFTSFLLLGKDLHDDFGIRAAVIFGAFLCIIGVITMFKYDEKEIMSYEQEMQNHQDSETNI